MLRKQFPGITGSCCDNCHRLAFVVINSLAITAAIYAIDSRQAIAQSLPPQIITADTNTPNANTPNTNTQIEAVANHLEGIMSTTAQAENDPNFVGVQMTTCRISITEPEPDSIYLYQEQALTASLNEPYRQRFLQITLGENNRIHSRTFKPENTSELTGLCHQPERTLTDIALGEQSCIISLRPAAIGGFVGSTPTEGCTANGRGATSITYFVVLHGRGMDTWDRGFDAAGNQVWGAQDTPYQYRRSR